jgi:3-methylcrotonyl-CoA carboxylase alpha subunit
VACGEPLPLEQSQLRVNGHSIEARVYAENPDRGFLPSTGTLSRLRLPAADASLRIDCGVREGDKVTHFYDPMIAKVIAHGADRPAAIERMLAALDAIEVEGVETNRAFLLRTIAHPAFRDGRVSTGFVDQHKPDLIG